MTHMGLTECQLKAVRVVAALNGLELFGHERGNIEVFRTLRDLGAEVLIGVNAAEGGGEVAPYLRSLGFEIFSLPFSNQWSMQWLKQHPLSFFEKVRAVARCSRIFRAQCRRFAATHVHLGSPLAYSYLAPALALSRIPLVYRMGDCPPLDSPFNLRLWRAAMARANTRVAISRFVRDAVEREGIGGVAVIHNLAPGRLQEQGRARDATGWERPPNILYLGSVAEHKGIAPLLAAFHSLRSDHAGIRLDIVGSWRHNERYRDRLATMVREAGSDGQVEFHGQVADPSPFLRQAAVLVAPSLGEEPLGNVVLEAKREGTPCVVFPSGGLPELVRHRIDGYICSEKTVDALVDALRWMLSDRARLAEMGFAARADEEERFGRARFARQWAEVYGVTYSHGAVDWAS